MISRESNWNRLGCAMNAPLTVGASPVGEGSSTGAIDASRRHGGRRFAAPRFAGAPVPWPRQIGQAERLAGSERIDAVFRRKDGSDQNDAGDDQRDDRRRDDLAERRTSH